MISWDQFRTYRKLLFNRAILPASVSNGSNNADVGLLILFSIVLTILSLISNVVYFIVAILARSLANGVTQGGGDDSDSNDADDAVAPTWIPGIGNENGGAGGSDDNVSGDVVDTTPRKRHSYERFYR